MAERIIKCPQCNAPLSPSRFAHQVVCSFCGATVQIDPSLVTAAKFREALELWNSPAHHGYSSWCSIGDRHWAVDGLIAHGEISDVYMANRARWPSERVLFKVLRGEEFAPLLEHEWRVLCSLQQSTATGAATFTTLVPQPVQHGVIQSGQHAGARALVLRWAPGFIHTFEAVRRAYPEGIEPRASVWMWRRILEVLSFLHRSGIVHGAVLPQHLLIQEHEHGIRLVGYSCADSTGKRLQAVNTRLEAFYPAAVLKSQILSPAMDVRMSARCIAFVLGAGPLAEKMPSAVPAPLAAFVQGVAFDDAGDASVEDAWSLRERLGELAQDLYGAPSFIPLRMPR